MLDAAAQMTPGATLLSNDSWFDYKDATHATYTRTWTILLDERADDFGVFMCSVNNGSTRLKSFSGEITEPSAKPRKLKKADLKYTEYSEGLADSYGTYFYSPTITSYPATITYSYTLDYFDAILGFPPFVPLPFTSGIGLDKASYTLTVPSDSCFSYHALNMPDIKPQRSVTKEGVTYRWTVQGLPKDSAEPYSPPAVNSMKAVMFTPARFSYEGKAGSGKSWVDIGNWIYSLSEDRATLPKELEDKVKSIAGGCSSEKEIISRIHDYLGETTRYVSIQLGLGGLRPLEPSFVFKNKFGDCKALSWYLKSMLDFCGIESHYVITNLGTDRMIQDFPSLATSNHAILCIPGQNDTLWVECTNPEVPLGYVHSGIAGNKALVVKKDGSFMTRLPKDEDGRNTDSMKVYVKLDADGNAEASIKQEVFNSIWETYHAASKQSSEKQVEFIKKDISLPMIKLSGLKLEDFMEAEPHCRMSCNASAYPYASKTGSRLFVPMHPFRNFTDNTTKSRKNNLFFKSGWVDNDLITIRIPEGFEIESVPEDFAYDSKFGHVECKMTRNEDLDEISLHFIVKHCSGTFPKEDFSDYKAFRKALGKLFGGKVVLTRTGSK